MMEHTCDECGKDSIEFCLCQKDLDVKLEKVFEDGRVEGFDQGYAKAKEELS